METSNGNSIYDSLTLASVWVGVFCILEIIDAFQSFSFEKYMRHRRANKKNKK